MKWISVILCAALAGASFGCASIFTGGRKDVNIRTNPSGAQLVITDEKGVEVFQGTTPTVVTLKTGKPYFRTKKYTVQLLHEGHEPTTAEIKSRVSGWYFGNLIFGGLLGMLIVDPLTGAMYTLPADHEISLIPSGYTHSDFSDGTLQVMHYRDVPDDIQSQLVRVN